MIEKGLETDFFVFGDMFRSLIKNFDSSALNLSINKTQQRVLMLIATEENTFMSNLCKQAGLEKGSFTSVVNSLIKQGYIYKISDDSDKRKIRLLLTEKGKEVALKLKKMMDIYLENIFSELTEGEKATLYNAFLTIKKISQRMMVNKSCE